MYKTKLKGFSLFELILAIGIFTMAISSFAFLGVEAYRTLRIAQNRIISSEKFREISDLVMLIKNESWGNIVDNTEDGSKFVFVDTDGSLSIEDGQEDKENYTYFFEINPAFRDANDNLVESGGNLDPRSRVINLTMSFHDGFLGTSEYNTKIYLNNWNTRMFSQSTYDEFVQGEEDKTEVVESDGGQIRLSREFLPDWCEPQHTHSRHSLHWWTIGEAIAARGEDAYIVTSEFFLGRSTFLHAKISPNTLPNPPDVSIEAEYDQGPGNDIYVQDNYAYIATDSQQDSVRIMDISEKPYTQVGNYATNSSRNATSVYVLDEYGFVGYGNSVDIFDINSRQKLGGRSIGSSSANVRDIIAKDNYLFVGMAGYNSQLVIIDISNVSNPQIISEIRVNNQNTRSIAISDDSNTVYIATSDERWFFPASPRFVIVNTTNKNNPSQISTTTINEMRRINDMVVVEDRAILGGAFDFSSRDNYLVLRVENPNAPQRCGGLRIPWGVRALDVAENEGRLFTYVLSLDPSYELQVVEGGCGGGDAFGEGHVPEGEYVSEIFYFESEITRLYSSGIYGQEPSGTSLKVQFKLGR